VLEALLTQKIFHFFLVFARIGSALMMLPGISGRHIPADIRLLVAMGVALVATPALSPQLPSMPATIAGQAIVLMGEIAIGLLFGILAEIVLASLHIAGTLISLQGGFANALIFDPITEQQGSVVTGLLDTIAVTLILVTDAHHLFIRALIDSYSLFAPGQIPDIGDFNQAVVGQVSASFLLGIKLASPFIVFSLVVQSAMGILSKLAPQMQVFFVLLPLQILITIALFAITLPSLMLWFFRHYESVFQAFLVPG